MAGQGIAVFKAVKTMADSGTKSACPMAWILELAEEKTIARGIRWKWCGRHSGPGNETMHACALHVGTRTRRQNLCGFEGAYHGLHDTPLSRQAEAVERRRRIHAPQSVPGGLGGLSRFRQRHVFTFNGHRKSQNRFKAVTGTNCAIILEPILMNVGLVIRAAPASWKHLRGHLHTRMGRADFDEVVKPARNSAGAGGDAKNFG